jgi:hypothetical protein
MRTRLRLWFALRDALRGLLAGCAAALALLLLSRVAPALRHPASVDFLVPLLGALVAAALPRRARVSLGAAALFLDRKWGTAGRVATVATCEPGALTERVAAEVAAARLPRLPLPREGAFAPAALFLLFAASLLPVAKAEDAAPPPVAAAVAKAAARGAGRAPAPPADPAKALQALGRGERPDRGEEAALRAAIDRRMRRPEERRQAHAALDRALGGDAAAARQVSEKVSGGAAASGPREGAAGGEAEGVRGNGEGRRRSGVVAYPEFEEFLRDYRNAVVEARQGR